MKPCVDTPFCTHNLILENDRMVILCTCEKLCPQPVLELGQTHMNGWSRVITSQNGGSTDYIFPFRLRVLQ